MEEWKERRKKEWLIYQNNRKKVLKVRAWNNSCQTCIDSTLSMDSSHYCRVFNYSAFDLKCKQTADTISLHLNRCIKKLSSFKLDRKFWRKNFDNFLWKYLKTKTINMEESFRKHTHIFELKKLSMGTIGRIPPLNLFLKKLLTFSNF